MHYMHKVLRLVTSSIGTGLSYKALGLLKDGDYAGLNALKPRDPSEYATWYHYLADAQQVALFKKLDGLPTGVDLKAIAENTFLECEEKNRVTNNRLAYYLTWFETGFCGDLCDEKLFLFIKQVRSIVASIMGPLPRDLHPYFGKGATFQDRGVEITIPHKMGSRPTVTSKAEFLCTTLYRGTLWDRAIDHSAVVVDGNRFTTVPKDSTKDRGICIEPSLNLSYQLSVGKLWRRRLKDVTGIDIKGVGHWNAQTVHRRLARESSVTGALATLDLSNASDLVSYNLVKLLLPKGWFDLASTLRSPKTLFKDQWINLQKFSSMGNGFTFELETILFYALSRALTDGVVSTYGDDMIVPSYVAPDLVSCLTLFGLEVNVSKSFSDPLGDFRESCGGDYFRGTPVRPLYFRKIPSTPTEWIELSNSIHALKDLGLFNDVLLDQAIAVCRSQVPTSLRLYGPRGVSGTFWSSDSGRWRIRSARCEQGISRGYNEILVVAPQPYTLPLTRFCPRVQLASALLGVPSKGPVPRNSIRGYKKEWHASVMT